MKKLLPPRAPRKSSVLFGLTFLLAFIAGTLGAQPTVCTPNAGPDVSVCTPNCATLTATYCPTYQTTSYSTSTIPYAPDPFNVGTAVTPIGDDQWSGVIN